MFRKISTYIVIIALILAGFGVYYRAELAQYFFPEGERSYAQKVTTTVSYEVPDGTDVEEFIVFLDAEGRIVDFSARDTEDPQSHAQTQLNAFSNELIKEIRGKKLSELEAVDKVGSSSLTTAAFNNALPNFKSQL